MAVCKHTHYREGSASLQLSVLTVLVPRRELISQLLWDMPRRKSNRVMPESSGQNEEGAWPQFKSARSKDTSFPRKMAAALVIW